MCSQDTNITHQDKKSFTIDDLSEEEWAAYNEQLAQQPQLIKAAGMDI